MEKSKKAKSTRIPVDVPLKQTEPLKTLAETRATRIRPLPTLASFIENYKSVTHVWATILPR
jgi:hypothetical protein